MLIAQIDHPLMLEWLANARSHGGGFLHAIAQAGLLADEENYPLLRPILVQLRAKYPTYEATKEVRQELAEVIKEWESANAI